MSGVVSRSYVTYDDVIGADSSVEKFLEQHFHRLARIIRPINFYSWLRQCTVFTQDDQEEVEFKYHTQSMKAGCLIDIIKRKGKAGFVAFMEVVEYSYPELFVEITGKKARPAPEDFSTVAAVIRTHGSKRVRLIDSDMMLINLGEMTNNLMQTLALKKAELSNLERILRNMQTNQEQLEEENASYFEQLQEAADVKEAQTAQIKRLEGRVQDVERELKQTTEQCNKLRLEKDKLESQCIQMMVANSAKAHVPVSTTKSVATGSDADERKQILPKAASLLCKDKDTSRPDTDYRQDSSKISCLTDKIKELQAINEELKRKDDQTTLENDSMHLQITELTAKLCILQSNSDKFLHSYNEMKNERDQFSEKCSDIERKYNDEKTKTEKLMTECQMFEERFRRMDETIQTLKKEIEQSKSLQQAGKSVIHDFVDRILNTPEEPTLPLPLSPPPPGDSKGATLRLRPSPRPPVIPGVTGKGELAKRQGSYFFAKPLFVYAPNEISRNLFDSLRAHYETCQYEIIPDDQNVIEKMTQKGIVDKIPLPDGKCRVITVESIRQYHQKTGAILMPALPPSCIAALEKKGFEPIVVVIKVESDSEFTQLSAIEEALDKYKVSNYEVILVESKIASDSSQLIEHVVKRVKEYVLK